MGWFSGNLNTGLTQLKYSVNKHLKLKCRQKELESWDGVFQEYLFVYLGENMRQKILKQIKN